MLSLHDPPGAIAGPGEMRLAGGRRSALAGWVLREALVSREQTVVVCMHLHLAPLALLLALRRMQVFVFLHGIEAWRPLSLLQRVALGSPRVGLIANSHYTEREFRRANPGLAARQVQVCHLGVDEPASPEALPGGLEPGFALAMGRLHEGYKGHDELLGVWPALLVAHPGARLVVAGDGPDRGRLEARSRALGLEGAVRFLGRVSDGEREALYRACAFLALPSRGEGFGLVYAEAMRAGRSCLAGPGAPAEVVSHGETGLVVDPMQRSDLEAALLRLFEDESSRERWGAAGRARQQALFTRDAFGARLSLALGLEPC